LERGSLMVWLAVVIVGLVVFDLLALRFGADTRWDGGPGARL
jgi:hypothetical protein